MTQLFKIFMRRTSKDEIIIKKALKSSGELLEHSDSMVRWLLHFCEENGINPPNEYQIRKSVERSQELIRKLPTDQPTGNTTNYQPSSKQNR